MSIFTFKTTRKDGLFAMLFIISLPTTSLFQTFFYDIFIIIVYAMIIYDVIFKKNRIYFGRGIGYLYINALVIPAKADG